MSLDKKTLKKLRDEIPGGSVPVVRKRLADAGHVYTRQYIYMVLNGSRHNQTVMDALLDHLERSKRQEAAMLARAKALTE